jgi:hypothetical protein
LRTEPLKALVIGAFVRGLSLRDVAVLSEALVNPDEQRAEAAAEFLRAFGMARIRARSPLPPGQALVRAHVEWVNRVLDETAALGRDHGEIAGSACMALLFGGIRAARQENPTQLSWTSATSRATRRSRAPLGSGSRRFWQRVAERADRELADAALEDQEQGEELL